MRNERVLTGSVVQDKISGVQYTVTSRIKKPDGTITLEAAEILSPEEHEKVPEMIEIPDSRSMCYRTVRFAEDEAIYNAEITADGKLVVEDEPVQTGAITPTKLLVTDTPGKIILLGVQNGVTKEFVYQPFRDRFTTVGTEVAIGDGMRKDPLEVLKTDDRGNLALVERLYREVKDDEDKITVEPAGSAVVFITAGVVSPVVEYDFHPVAFDRDESLIIKDTEGNYHLGEGPVVGDESNRPLTITEDRTRAHDLVIIREHDVLMVNADGEEPVVLEADVSEEYKYLVDITAKDNVTAYTFASDHRATFTVKVAHSRDRGDYVTE